LAIGAFKAQALGDLECRDDAPLDLLAGLSGPFRTVADIPSGSDRGEKRIGRERLA
jgi:hypothetical protein